MLFAGVRDDRKPAGYSSHMAEQTSAQPLPKVLYTAHVTATGGRDGVAKSSDGKLEVRVTPPKELGGNGEGTNPEQLFAAGYAAGGSR